LKLIDETAFNLKLFKFANQLRVSMTQYPIGERDSRWLTFEYGHQMTLRISQFRVFTVLTSP